MIFFTHCIGSTFINVLFVVLYKASFAYLEGMGHSQTHNARAQSLPSNYREDRSRKDHDIAKELKIHRQPPTENTWKVII